MTNNSWLNEAKIMQKYVNVTASKMNWPKTHSFPFYENVLTVSTCRNQALITAFQL